MKVTLKKYASCLLVVSGLVLAPIASAEMISTQDSASAQKLQSDREKVRSFLDRANVQEKLHTMGVEAAFAKDRVNALTDQEVTLLAQKIDSLPAGASLSTTDIILILLVAILVAVVI